MANRRKEDVHSDGHSKGKIRFRYMDTERTLDFSVENMPGHSVTDGLRSIANALAGRTIAPVPGKKAALNPAPEVDFEEELETPQEETPEAEVLEAEPESEESNGTPKPKRVRKPKAPKLLATPVLTEAKVPLADFMKQKGATDMQDKYAVVAAWYKEQFQITDMTIDRVFTAFKHLGQESQLPTDVEKPLKNLTYVKKWFDKKPNAAGTYTINWVGESEIGKMGVGAVKA
jgi:hypothetical protein